MKILTTYETEFFINSDGYIVIRQDDDSPGVFLSPGQLRAIVELLPDLTANFLIEREGEDW